MFLSDHSVKCFTRQLCEVFLLDHCVRYFYQTTVPGVFIRPWCQVFLSDDCVRCFYQTIVSGVFIRRLCQVFLSDHYVRCFYQTIVSGVLSDHRVGYLHQVETEPILTEQNKTGRFLSDFSVLHCRRFLCRTKEHFS